MKKDQTNKLAMYMATLELMNQNNGIWGSVPAIVNQVALLDQKIAAIHQQSTIVSSNISGVTQTKQAMKEDLANLAHVIAAALVTYAVDTNNTVLRERVSYTLSDFRHAADNKIIERAGETHQYASQHITALADYNITAQALADLQQYITDFTEKSTAPRLARAARKTATTALSDLFDEADQLLKVGLDHSINTFKLSQPAFYQTYTNARAIIDLGHSSKYIEVEVPPMSHIAVYHVVIGSELRNAGSVAITVIGDDPSNEEGVQLIPDDNMVLLLSQPVITVQNFHTTLPGRVRVRVTSKVPITNITRASQAIFNIAAGSSLRIQNIVRGAEIENLGPAAITMCDCTQPDCNITDDDQPCGYEQTIEAAQRGHANTAKGYLNATNKEEVNLAKIKVWVFSTNPSRPSPEPLNL